MQSGMTIKNTLDSCVSSVPTFLAALTRSPPITYFAVSPVFADGIERDHTPDHQVVGPNPELLYRISRNLLPQFHEDAPRLHQKGPPPNFKSLTPKGDLDTHSRNPVF